MASQLLHYSRDLSPHWLDLAHVVAGAPMHLQAARIAPAHLRHAYTDELPAQPHLPAAAQRPAWPRRVAGTLALPARRTAGFAVSLAAALVSLALPGSSWFIDTLRH